MEKLLIDLLEESKKSKEKLILLKHVAVKCQQFELAANLREIEKELFPDTEEMKIAKERATNLLTVLKLVELTVPLKLCWVIDETIKKYNKKKGKFSLRDAALIISKRDEIFTESE